MNIKYFFYLLICCALLSSCDPRFGGEPMPYTSYTPVIMARESLERSVFFHTPENIVSPAKIYYKDNFIYISERYKGIHVIDNINPKLPVNKGYISIPGCVDMAIKDNTLYADNAVDLIAIDISNMASLKIEVKKRIKSTFPELAPPDGYRIPSKYDVQNRPQNTVIVNWTK